MVAYVKEMAVNSHKWLDEDKFKDGVALCQTIPGATAMQTAAYVGLRARGVIGALASFVGFGLPNYRDVFIAITAGALFWTGVSPFAAIIGSACAGALLMKSVTKSLSVRSEGIDRSFVKQFTVLLSVLLSGLVVLYLIDARLLNLAVLMTRIDLFAFGGGFASIPLMLHEIVNVRGWMDSKTFMDGIALGQVTPGPIVITSTFVGYMLYGVAGATIATVGIFAPSFLMVIAVTPVFDRLKASAYFIGATKGILASFVGLLFFVAVKFALAVPWDVMRVFVGVAAFAALLKKVDILYVVV
ncbi:MAG: chromate transporter, chromate ion transporter family, partial [Nitrospirae bacterium]|nr:chromate transporter, chromate ion transporter family [Nitrospirota bacterium]